MKLSDIQVRVHLESNSALMAEKGGHVCASCQHGPKGCCAACGYQEGYLKWRDDHPHNSPQFLKGLKELYGFTEKDGFWSPQGCKLPREKRSNTCLRYACHDLVKAAGRKYHFGDPQWRYNYTQGIRR